MAPKKEREPQRIAKLLARAGVASRRDIERMIEERRIAINGVAVEKPATLLTSLHGVTVDGMPIKEPAPARLFRFHKPTGLLTAARDPAGRPTIYDRLPDGLPRLMPVGRLDMNTEGLLLLTTDGELKRQLELPSTGVERTYRARVFGEVSQEQLEELIHGVEIEGIRYGSIDANLERRTGRNGWVEMRLTEGKNREVRRVLEYLGLQVSRLIRTSYGPFELQDLPSGAVDEVRQHDLVAFKSMLSGKKPSATQTDPDAPRPSRPPRARPPMERSPRPLRSGAPACRDAPRSDRAAPDEARGSSRAPAKSARPFARPERRPADEAATARGPRGRSAPARGRSGPHGDRATTFQGRDRASKDDRASFVDRDTSRTGPRERLSPKAGRPAAGERGSDTRRGGRPGGGAPKGGRPGPKGGRPTGRGAPKR